MYFRVGRSLAVFDDLFRFAVQFETRLPATIRLLGSTPQ